MTQGMQTALATGLPVYALAFADEGHLFLAGGGGPGRSGVANAIKATEIDARDGALAVRTAGELKLNAHEDAPMCLAVHPETRSLVCGINAAPDAVRSGDNAHVRLFGYALQRSASARADVAEGQSASHVMVQPVAFATCLGFNDPEHYQKIAQFSPDGGLLAVGSTDGRLQLLRYPSMEPVWSRDVCVCRPGEELYDADFSQNGTQLACATSGRVLVLSTAPKRTGPDGAPVYGERILQTIDNAAIGGTRLRGTFRAARFGRGSMGRVGTRDVLYTLLNAAPAKDRKHRESFLVAWNADTWNVVASRRVAQRPATALAVSPNGRLVACGASDLSICVFQGRSLRSLLTIPQTHDFPPTCLAFSPRSRAIASGSADSSR
ncbi:hypothetical protein MSPP1_002599 [Malassezia sp. CBS 17886]|nr:hypothetical protein MSPP1_002599 [Malassezia sp. CBS 17886]